MANKFNLFAGLGVVLFGVGILALGGYGYFEMSRFVREAIATPCIITRYEARKDSDGDEYDYYYFKFSTLQEIEVDESKMTAGAGDRRYRGESFAIGEKYTCWFDPKKPRHAELRKPSQLVPLCFLGIALAIAAGFIGVGISSLKDWNRARTQVDTDEPA